MGAGQSGGVEIGGNQMGYQVLRVYPDSPGSRAGLKAYFDFIVAIGNTRFDKENGSLREILKASIDQKLKMVVYNTRSKIAREVEIVPSNNWGGGGLLGISIKHCSFDRADERVWHVTEVDPGSPAQQAGFRPNEDYVIGSDSILQENDDLYNLIETHEGKALKLFVYNSETDNCREIICHPNSKWGGRGYLGCEFGHGLLHRIPYKDKQNDNIVKSLNSSSGDIDHLLASGGGSGKQQSAAPTSSVSSAQSPLEIGGQNGPNRVINQPQTTQPGHQMLQQVLFLDSNQMPQQHNQEPPSYQHQHQQQQQPQTTQVPQTFAQLANAQFLQSQQSNQYQQLEQSYAPTPQQPPPSNQYQQLPPPSTSTSSEVSKPQAEQAQQPFVQPQQYQQTGPPVYQNQQVLTNQQQYIQQTQLDQQPYQHPYQQPVQFNQQTNDTQSMQPYQNQYGLHQFQNQPPPSNYQPQPQQANLFVPQPQPNISDQVQQPSNTIQNQASNSAGPAASETPGSWLSGRETFDSSSGQMRAPTGATTESRGSLGR